MSPAASSTKSPTSPRGSNAPPNLGLEATAVGTSASLTAGKSKPRARGAFERGDQVFSCWRKKPQRLVIRELYYDSYSVPTVAGGWLAYGAEHSDQDDYSSQVSIFDLRTGRKDSVSALGRVVALVVKENGSVAYVSRASPTRSEVVVADRDGREVAYSGAGVSAASLRRAGNGSIAWSVDGRRRTARLR